MTSFTGSPIIPFSRKANHKVMAMLLPASKRRDLIAKIILALALVAWPATAGDKASFTIVDGDSLDLGGQRFDLFGIDSPEPGTQCRKKNGETFDCGRIATTALLDLTAGADVTCVPKEGAVAASADAVPALCESGGFSLNRNMVHTGWAIADPADGGEYANSEEGARAAKRGLWRWSWTVQPPWTPRPK
jgi:endonuclease YncB( thermonuclease family)